MASRQSRKYQITINDPKEKGMDHEQIRLCLNSFNNLVYWCMSDEIGLESKLYHTHLYIICKSPVRFDTVKKRFPEAHIEQSRGTSKENKEYVTKTGKWSDDAKHETSVPDTFEEWGELPEERQGARTDLEQLYEMVKDGKSNVEILEENPNYLLRINDIERVRQTLRHNEYRNKFRELTVIYVWGSTGSGKTSSVLEAYGYEACYRVTDYQHPFDSYNGEDVLVLDEYRSDFRVSELLNIIDGFPLELPCRYSNRVACFTKVFIISNLDLTQQYRTIQKEQPETWKAILRRIHTVRKFFSDGHYVDYKTNDYLHGFVEVEIGSTPFDNK